MFTHQCEHFFSSYIRCETQKCLRDDDDNDANDDDDSNNDSDVTITIINRMQVVMIMKFSQRCCLRLEFCWTLNAALLVPDVSKGDSAFIWPWKGGTTIVLNVGYNLTSDREYLGNISEDLNLKCCCCCCCRRLCFCFCWRRGRIWYWWSSRMRMEARRK